MTSQPWKPWPAQSPSDGFVDRTVDALLASQPAVVRLRADRRGADDARAGSPREPSTGVVHEEHEERASGLESIRASGSGKSVAVVVGGVENSDKDAGRVTSGSRGNVAPLRRRRRWVGVLAFAALLAAGSSWAMIHHMMAAPAKLVEPASSPAPHMPGLLADEVQPPRAAASSFAEPAARLPARPKRASVAASAPARATASLSAPTRASVAPPARVIAVPRCDCEPGTQICACVHE